MGILQRVQSIFAVIAEHVIDVSLIDFLVFGYLLRRPTLALIPFTTHGESFLLLVWVWSWKGRFASPEAIYIRLRLYV